MGYNALVSNGLYRKIIGLFLFFFFSVKKINLKDTRSKENISSENKQRRHLGIRSYCPFTRLAEIPIKSQNEICVRRSVSLRMIRYC